MEQELSTLEPKYGKYVDNKRYHKNKSPSPEPTPRIAINGSKSTAKETMALLK